MSKREFRFVEAHELRIQATEKGKRISGYAAVYNSPSCDLGGFTEVIAPGAFDRCLGTNPDVACLHEHDRRQGLLGRTTSGTLRLSSDSLGLRFETDLPNTTLGNDVAESISRRSIRLLIRLHCERGSVDSDPGRPHASYLVGRGSLRGHNDILPGLRSDQCGPALEDVPGWTARCRCVATEAKNGTA